MTSLSVNRSNSGLFSSARTRLLVDIAAIMGFAVLTAACAQISFWIGTVPITGQTLGVLLSGLILGSRKGALSQLSYIAIGMTGIPYWFALGGPPGIMRLIGPTGGYLIGFVAMSFITGWLFEKHSTARIWNSVLAALAGTVILYFAGIIWLSIYLPATQLLPTGLYPFIVGDLIKILAATLVLRTGMYLASKFMNPNVIHG
jgi:biotin transporter BioY